MGKTRINATGKYLNNNSEYHLIKMIGEDKLEELILQDGTIFKIDDVPITVKSSKTRSGEFILTCSYFLFGKKYETPLFNNQTGRWANTEGALTNGLFHRNAILSNIQEALVDKDISIRSVKYVDNEDDLKIIYEIINVDNTHVFKEMLEYITKYDIKITKLIPNDNSRYTVYPLSEEEYINQVSNGYMIIERKIKDDDRIIPSIIFIVRDNVNEKHLINHLEKYSIEN